MTVTPFSHIFKCATCEDMPEFDHPGFIDHIKTIHNSGDKPQGKRSMLTHVDGRDFFSSSYSWEFDFNGDIVSAVEQIRQPRRVNNPLREEE